MKTFSHYLIVMLMVMLFIFRLIVVFTTTMGIEFFATSLNPQMEIVLLFVTLPCIALIAKSKVIGTIIMIIGSIMYYGPNLFNNVLFIFNNNVVTVELILSTIISLVSVLIPIVAFFVVMFAKQQEKHPVNKKTDFFYKNEEYDRKYDERADKNNYRTL